MLCKEIGSNYCETIEISTEYLEDNQQTYFFDSGRSAINVVLESMPKIKRKVVLPRYTCESVIKPFIRHNFEIRYYKVNRNFEIDEDEFAYLIENFKPDIVYVHSYFGLDTFTNVKETMNNLYMQNIIVIEDVTHNMFSNNEHINADFYVGSMRKWCSLPDAGVLRVASDKAKRIMKDIIVSNENKEFLETRIRAQREKELYFANADNASQKDFIEAFDKSESILDNQKDTFTMSKYSRMRVNSIDWEQLKKARRDNYKYLVSILQDIEEIEIIAQEIDDNIVPLYCPVYITDKRNDLRVYARERNVMLPVIWPIPSGLNQCLDEEDLEIYNHILAIPCDQRYSNNDMERIGTVLKDYFESEKK